MGYDCFHRGMQEQETLMGVCCGQTNSTQPHSQRHTSPGTNARKSRVSTRDIEPHHHGLLTKTSILKELGPRLVQGYRLALTSEGVTNWAPRVGREQFCLY
eukprot:965971-Amphidinium_carterae.1